MNGSQEELREQARERLNARGVNHGIDYDNIVTGIVLLLVFVAMVFVGTCDYGVLKGGWF